MKKTLLITTLFSALLFGLAFAPSVAQAAGITNPVIGALGDNAKTAETGATFTSYFVTIWRALIFVGVLALLFNLVNGAFDWILAGGESAKIAKGRDKMIQSVLGMVVLALSFIIISFLSQLLFKFDLLNLTIPKAAGPGATLAPVPQNPGGNF